MNTISADVGQGVRYMLTLLVLMTEYTFSTYL